MTPKQREFVNQYLIDLNATQAAVRAGYSERRAQEIGYQLLHKTTVAEAVRQALTERSERAKLDADWVLNRLKEEAEDYSENGSPASRVRATELIGKHLGMFPTRTTMSLALEGQVDVNHSILLEGRRVARRLILEEVREQPLLLPGIEE
jgi:hypothetical protein